MTPTELAIELVRAANVRDLEAATDLFHPTAELCFPRFAPRPVFRGGSELAEFFAWLDEAMPRQVIAVDRVSASGDAATVEFEITGTSSRGTHFDSVGVLVIDTREGRISSVRCYVDTADLGRILGEPAA